MAVWQQKKLISKDPDRCFKSFEAVSVKKWRFYHHLEILAFQLIISVSMAAYITISQFLRSQTRINGMYLFTHNLFI